MIKGGQKITKEAYEDPIIVSNYLKMYGEDFHKKLANEFANSLSGKRIIDLGCGPGHYCYYFAELGLDVVGIDYSSEMIKTAENLKKTTNQPRFIVGDLRELEKHFKSDSFDGAWANAVILHIPIEDVQKVLKGIRAIVKNEGKVLIRTKVGKGTRLVRDTRYGKPIKKEYIFWEKDNLTKEVKKAGFRVERVVAEHEVERDRETDWLQFYLEVVK